MLRTTIILSLLIACVFSSPARIFAWSNSNIQGQQVYNYNVVGNDDLLPLFLSTTGVAHPSFGQHFSESTPDLTVLFVSDNTSPALEASLKNAAGSVVLPYVSGKQDEQISAITEFASQAGSVVFAGPSSLSTGVAGTQLEVDDVLSKIQSGQISNGLLIVDLSGRTAEEADQVISSFNQAVDNKSAVSVFVQLATQEKNLVFAKSVKKHIPIRQVLDYGAAPPYNTKWPAYVVEALWVSAFLILLGVIGVVCICQIQGPYSFETKHKGHANM